MAYNDLNEEERFVLEWQKQMSGSFMTALAETICKGDLSNQARLAQGFPDAVSGIQKFQNESGWWEAVQEKYAS